MTERKGSDDEGLREAAEERIRRLPGETARGRFGPEGAERRAEAPDASREGTPDEADRNARGAEGTSRPGVDFGDRSTGGEAAREAIGAEPEESGGEVEDRSTGRASRRDVRGDGG